MTAAPTLSEKLHEQGTGASIVFFCCSVLQAESCGLEDSFDQAGQSTWDGIPAALREAPEVYGALSLALLRKTPRAPPGPAPPVQNTDILLQRAPPTAYSTSRRPPCCLPRGQGGGGCGAGPGTLIGMGLRCFTFIVVYLEGCFFQ